ncbi:MAG: hypothetical protein MZW92_66090 [Comamonadaceae bacterium]|nr:hypothetical protein [Comamonadaceae bacterium]
MKAAALRTKVWPERRAAIDAPEHRWAIGDTALRQSGALDRRPAEAGPAWARRT